MKAPGARRAARAVYLLLLAWQPIWLALLPPPVGKASWPLAIMATVPLLLPLNGILRLKTRALVWAGYLALFYFVFGVTEWWSAPPQRGAAATETLLAATFLAVLLFATRRR